MNKHNNISDELLMQRIQLGNQEAFNELYLRYSKRILYFMYKMLKQDEAKAQDLMQDVFLKIVEHPQKFDTKQSFKTWIFTVAANRCKNYFRTQNSKKELAAQIPEKQENTTRTNIDDFKEKLNIALAELPYQYRETFILKHKEGLLLQEIALVMDCPLGTVKSRLNSATKLLAKKLAPYKTELLTQY